MPKLKKRNTYVCSKVFAYGFTNYYIYINMNEINNVINTLIYNILTSYIQKTSFKVFVISIPLCRNWSIQS